MGAKANYFKLGLFVIAGVTVAVIALLALGAARIFARPLLIETYLDQSAQGLEVGSKAKFRGVDIGNVHAITFTRTRYEQNRRPAERRRYVLVEVALDPEKFPGQRGQDFIKEIHGEVGNGLRFRLNSQGITGLSYLELDYVDPVRNPPLEINWQPVHPYIPSAPGTFTRLLTSAEQVFRKLESVDLAAVLTNMNTLLNTASDQIRDANIAEISGQATNLLVELRGSNQRLQTLLGDPHWSQVASNAAGATAGLKRSIDRADLQGVADRLRATLQATEAFIAGKDQDLDVTLKNLRALSENLRALSETARAYPAGILFGAPPKAAQGSR